MNDERWSFTKLMLWSYTGIALILGGFLIFGEKPVPVSGTAIVENLEAKESSRVPIASTDITSVVPPETYYVDVSLAGESYRLVTSEQIFHELSIGDSVCLENRRIISDNSCK